MAFWVESAWPVQPASFQKEEVYFPLLFHTETVCLSILKNKMLMPPKCLSVDN